MGGVEACNGKWWGNVGKWWGNCGFMRINKGWLLYLLSVVNNIKGFLTAIFSKKCVALPKIVLNLQVVLWIELSKYVDNRAKSKYRALGMVLAMLNR